MDAPAIEIQNVSKLFSLEAFSHRTLRDSINRRWARWLGRTLTQPSAFAINPAQAGPVPNSFWAVRDVSAVVRRGEIVGIIGRNGAGKSTLLKILSRITAPTQGRVILRGRVGSLLEVGAGFHPELSGRENIFLNGAILGMKKVEIERQLDAIIEFADVGAFIDTPVKRYSSGMYVRLAFAVAAHLDPDILIVDEVLAVGDARFQRKCLGKMEQISSGEGRTVLFVSHNLEAIQRLCGRCLFLDGGRLIREGPTKEVISDYLGSGSSAAGPDRWIDISGIRRTHAGGACFTAIRFSSNSHRAANLPFSDGPLEFELLIHSSAPTSVQSMAIGLRDELGRRLINIDTGIYGETHLLQPGTTKVRLQIEALHLKPGIYSVALWLARYAGGNVSGSDILDYVERAVELEVIELAHSETRMSIGQTGVVTCKFRLAEFSRTELLRDSVAVTA
jgi:lipopolysaccharide transport system ATP-binding protein